MLTACAVCGELSDQANCEAHRPPARKRPWTEAGYTGSWARLSRRARREQPFCSVCLATEDLTCDHSPEAWERKEQGLPIRLQDVDVLCRRCNASKGAAR